ncbi:Rieske 2Fe-2S domain-containing protein [Acaryochloris sp. 'Moss Beach']|uniref:Rieske 2Fe-2S domain-containing protein n=1 Tax=Acaryochloris sp. 'Moss Beach' TaxID=2740837 RepID=UPI0028F400EF|nr:Rieske 2Fe-2S domain-containing protein [Acaryochloris sp. 'Moss Beach']
MTIDIDLKSENLSGLESQPTAERQPLNWLKQWYPVSPLNYLDNSCPTPPITLLGKNLVIWQHQGQWIAMDDVCPHKLTRLSLGKIQTDGTLVCRQHGWCFDQKGQCVKNPMLADPTEQAVAYCNVRSHVTTYPTQVEQGLLWIWPDHNAQAFTDCQQKQPATLPEPGSKWHKADWHMIEVPIGYTVSIENSFDPVHAQFLHEGISGFSPANAIPMQGFKLVDELSAEDGFVLSHKGYNTFNREMEATRTFRPPLCQHHPVQLANGWCPNLSTLFCPDSTRILSIYYEVRDGLRFSGSSF